MVADFRHRALPVESGTFVHDEGFALNRAFRARGGLKFDAFAGLHPTPEPTSDRNDRNLDLGIDIGRFADDETVAGADGALELAVDAQRVVKRDLALE